MILVVFPIITMAFLKPAFRAALQQGGYPHANGAEQVVPGQAVVNAFFVVSLTTFAFFSEFGYMTWDRLRASPATSLEIVLGKAIPRVAMVVAQLFVVLVAGVVIFDLNIRGNVLALIPLVLMFSISLVMLGVAVTAICRTAQQANVVRVRRHGAVRRDRRRARAVQRPAAVGPHGRTGHAHVLGDARIRVGHPRRPGPGRHCRARRARSRQ